jgi:putative ABC transport system permease protein
MMRGWRAALRIARRDAIRHKGRSVLVIAMIAVPVLGLSAADVLARTMQLSADERVSRDIGTSDAGLQLAGGKIPPAAPLFYGYGDPHRLPRSSAAYARLRQQAFRTLDVRDSAERIEGGGSFTANGRTTSANVTELTFGSPLVAGIAELVSGHEPRSSREVAVSPLLARQLGVGVGDTVAAHVVQHGRLAVVPYRVSAVMRNRMALGQAWVYAQPTAGLAGARPVYLVRTGRPVSLASVVQLDAQGVVIESRELADHPPAYLAALIRSHFTSPDRIGVATVAIGLAILEVVLLAGTAFAVGARRQRRDLALVGAAGGDRATVAMVVLAGGMMLGAVGGIAGAAGGVGLARLALANVADRVGRAPGHFDVRAVEVLGVAALGVLTGLVACLLPARAAMRDSVVAALGGRRLAQRVHRGVPVTGVVMIVAGAIIAAQAAIHFHFRLILAGATISELGFVTCAPSVVSLVSRLAPRLPLAPRLALRDAARHRGRSGPAVAAVMAAIAGCVAVSCYFASVVHRDKADYRPQTRVGQALLEEPAGPHFGQRRQLDVRTVSAQLAPRSITRLRAVDCLHAGATCHEFFLGVTDSASQTTGNVVVGGVEVLRSLVGGVDAGAEAALTGGKLVAFSAAPPEFDFNGGLRPTAPPMPSYLDPQGADGSTVAGIVSPATASRYHLETSRRLPTASYLVVTADGQPPAKGAIADLDERLSGEIVVGRPYSAGGYGAGLIVLAAAAAIVMLGATAVSVGLSMAESKPDLVTLTAVGGTPLTRRLLVASQSGTVAVLGALLGVIAGLIPAWAVLRANHAIPFVVPWTTIGFVVVVLPVVAMVATAACAGQRLTLERRPT